MSHVATATHEVRGSLVWTDHGEAPYWATRELVLAADGGGTFDLDVNALDEEIESVSLGYKGSGISPRPTDGVDQIREYKLFWTTSDGGRFGGFIKPRFEADEFRRDEPDKPFEERERISVPEDLGAAVAFSIEAGTYRDPEYYPRVLPVVLEALADHLSVGWDDRYLRRAPASYSSITDLEQTVRISREESKKLLRGDGTFLSIFQLLADREGSSVVYAADNSEVVGYNHRLQLEREDVEQLIPGFPYGVQIKLYHPKHPRNAESKDDPLYHPRIGVLFKKGSLNSAAVSWSDHEELARRLEELLVNVLKWSGVPIKPSTPPFVPDDRQEIRESDREIAIHSDPTPEIETRQESIIVRSFADLLEEDVGTLETLATDGGRRYDDLADETGRSVSAIYRLLERAGDLLKSYDGVVKFASEKMREDVLEIVESVEHTVETGVSAIAHYLGLDERHLEQKGSAWQKWLEKYAVEPIENGDGLTLKVRRALDRLKSTSKPRLEDVATEAIEALGNAGVPRSVLQEIRISWHAGDRRYTPTRLYAAASERGAIRTDEVRRTLE